MELNPLSVKLHPKLLYTEIGKPKLDILLVIYTMLHLSFFLNRGNRGVLYLLLIFSTVVRTV